jgi:iron-sulfur cluster assembly accessory protein
MTKEMIDREMTIEEIFDRFPSKAQLLAQEISNRGLNCVGCQAATWETLEAGMLGHGFSDEEINDLVSRLNAILNEKVDATTITMTKAASAKYREILKMENKESWGLRLSDRAAGCSGFEYVLDFSEKPQKSDIVFHSEGVDIHVNEKIVGRMLGSQIDFVDGLSGSGFKITNPNVKSSCGCGKSQSY